MEKVKKIMLFVCLTALLCCCDPGMFNETNTHNQVNHLDITPGISRSVVAPEFAAYVGDGYDMLKLNTSPLEAIKGHCLANLEVRRILGQANSYSRTFIAENQFSMDFNLNFHHDSSAGIKLFDVASASGSFTMDIVNNLHFSSKTIAMVGIVEYSDSIAYINQATMTPEARTLYESNRSLFEEQYGNGYCEKVELGERLIAVFTYTFKDFKNYTKLDYKTTAEAHFLEIFDGKTNTNVGMDMTVFTQNTEIHSYCFATGNFIPGYIGTREDFVAQYNAWVTYTNNKINSSTATLSVINRIYQPYSKILALQETSTLDIYAEMLYEWKKTASQIRIVMNDTSDSALIQECRDALVLIQNEIVKCQGRAADARFPRVNEFPAIQRLWILKTSLPLYKLKATQTIPLKFSVKITYFSTNITLPVKETSEHVYDYYVCVAEEDLTDTINQLKNDNPDTVFQYEKMIGYIPQLNIPDSYPLYVLTGPDKFSVFLTTDKEERNQKLYNEEYSVPPEGGIIGYLFQEQLYNFTPFHQVQINVDNDYELNITFNNSFTSGKAINTSSFINFFYTFNQAEKDYWNTTHTEQTSKTVSGVLDLSGIPSFIRSIIEKYYGEYSGKMRKKSVLTPVINRTLGYLPAVN
ncbi:MAG: hypothetical protein JXB88_23835 [Spirochaetales bacterium]|nr:hypothetical protein [Spirochaetales bacterium]